MKVLIVEDESMASKRLIRLITIIAPNVDILASLDSVKRAVNWLNTNESPDLIFLDIQLADGLSFEIFEKTKVTAPIIFTTAFDEYAIKAFKVNSIDYLLKPIDPKELENAMGKFKSNFSQQPSLNMALIESAMEMMTKQYKERFVVKIGDHIKTVNTRDALYFYSQEKATFLQVAENKRYIIDYTLEEVERLLDPKEYFRINRKYLVQLGAVKDIIAYSNSRLRLILIDSDEMDVIVSRDKVQAFKKWLDK